MLTPYASKCVREQYGKRSKVKVVDGRITKDDNHSRYMFMYISPSDEITLQTHFAYRECHHQPLFDGDLAHGKWHLINDKKPIALAVNWAHREVRTVVSV